MVENMRKKGNPPTLLAGMQIGATTMDSTIKGP